MSLDSGLFERTLTDVYDGVRFGQIALQYPQGKANQQQLHLRISAKRLIQALLDCPTLSKWSTQRKGEKERKKRCSKARAEQNRGLPLGGRDAHETQSIFDLFFFLFLFFKPTKNKPTRRKVGSKKDAEEPARTRGKTERTGGP